MNNRVLNPKQSVRFDVNNPTHLKIYADFLTTGRWNSDIRFMLEDPHQVIPTMIERKLSVEFLRQQSVLEQTAQIIM